MDTGLTEQHWTEWKKFCGLPRRYKKAASCVNGLGRTEGEWSCEIEHILKEETSIQENEIKKVKQEKIPTHIYIDVSVQPI